MSTKKLMIVLLVLIIIGIIICIVLSLNNKNNVEGMPTQGKIDINMVCTDALAYMSFPDGAAADRFVAECKEGKHPEVIEEFKKRMNLGDGAAI